MKIVESILLIHNINEGGEGGERVMSRSSIGTVESWGGSDWELSILGFWEWTIAPPPPHYVDTS